MPTTITARMTGSAPWLLPLLLLLLRPPPPNSSE
jgi:hypothetical protein